MFIEMLSEKRDVVAQNCLCKIFCWDLIARQGSLKFMNCEFQLVPVPRHLHLCPHLPVDQTTPGCFHPKSQLASHRFRTFKKRDVKVSAMNFSSLNVDVLLRLMKFLDQDDRFNLVVSGVLKGFENAIEGIDLRERFSQHFTCDLSGNSIFTSPESKVLELNWGHVVMARASQKSGESSREFFLQQLNQWNVILNRSLKDRWPYYELTDKKRLTILKRLAAGGFFKNNRQMIVEGSWSRPSIHRFYQVVRSMADLEKLSLLNWKLRLTQDVPKLFQSCPKLSELHLNSQKNEFAFSQHLLTFISTKVFSERGHDSSVEKLETQHFC